ncbi:MAG: hypothetical protein ACTSO2_19520 [Promethearchaeota archaeon]
MNNKKEYPYLDKTILLLKKVVQIVNIAAGLAKDAKWLYSDDIGESYFQEVIAEKLRILKKL